MALKVKAVERLVKFNKTDAGVWRYVMSPELYTALNQQKVIREAARWKTLRTRTPTKVVRTRITRITRMGITAATAAVTTVGEPEKSRIKEPPAPQH